MTDSRVAVSRVGSSLPSSWFWLAAATLLLCSCRGLDPVAPPAAAPAGPAIPIASPATTPSSDVPWSGVAPTAMAGRFSDGPPCPSFAVPPIACQPEPACPCGVHCGPWTPPGLPCPWPEDEYLCDGGDQPPAVRVRSDWSLAGLELEDTVVHFDTLDGQTLVEPSNRVCIYAPRFAAVRKVYGLAQHQHHEGIGRVEQPIPIEGLNDVQIATTAVQPLQPGLKLGSLSASGFRERTPPTGLENSQGLIGAHGGLLPYEDFTIIRRGTMDNSEKARLAERMQAAVAWSHDTAVQVLIDNIATHEDVGLSGAQSVHIYELKGKSRLQVCKIASRKEARPGETVEFTIRFDNVGDQTIGNVTVIDNLTTRLEYVEGSQTSTVAADFSVADNQGESLTLRWEVGEPLRVGQGGVIRFQCRVR
jgi:uncharacterized repeat protein (TIGR01451 family)